VSTPSCKDLIDFLDDYLAGRLSDPVRARFEQHMAQCPPCKDYLRTYRDTVELARESCRKSLALPEGMPELLVKAIVESRNGPLDA